MKIRTDDLITLADAITVLNDDANDEIDIIYRRKIATRLEELYWRALKAWHEQFSSSRRACQTIHASRS